ncbi:hypothetical protein [Anabaena sp. CCY 9910]|uniref:hypothetical protein n=1 Tax=Anabaena sp. CCY 9910 TaxID=3103870 RepID=UPI0039E148A9
MATKEYCRKYRHLKRVFESTYQKPVSDIFWYRLTAQLKQYLNFSVERRDAELIVRSIANLKKSHRNFRVNSDNFSECWQLFQHYYKQKKHITCAEFLADLAQQLDLSQVSRTSRYNWFTKAGIPYRHEKTYSTSDFALVAFQAVKCLKSRELKRVDNAIKTINVLVVR